MSEGVDLAVLGFGRVHSKAGKVDQSRNFLLLKKLHWHSSINHQGNTMLLLTGKRADADFLSYWCEKIVIELACGANPKAGIVCNNCNDV